MIVCIILLGMFKRDVKIIK